MLKFLKVEAAFCQALFHELVKTQLWAKGERGRYLVAPSLRFEWIKSTSGGDFSGRLVQPDNVTED